MIRSERVKMVVRYVGNILKCFFFSSSRSDSDEDVSIISFLFLSGH